MNSLAESASPPAWHLRARLAGRDAGTPRGFVFLSCHAISFARLRGRAASGVANMGDIMSPYLYMEARIEIGPCFLNSFSETVVND